MRIVVVGGAGTAGKAVVHCGRARHHHMVVASRRTGTDVRSGNGLAEALRGADIVIDVSSVQTLSRLKATRFFRSSMTSILTAAEHARVYQVVRLSIIGVDLNPHGFYAAQLEMERLCNSSPVPTTILRSAQFHEFAAQTLTRASMGPVRLAPRAKIQPVAVQEVGARLIDIAESDPMGRAQDLAGPQPEELSEMIRAYAEHTGQWGMVRPVNLPGAMMRGLRRGLSLPGAEADLGVQTFHEWLEELPTEGRTETVR